MTVLRFLVCQLYLCVIRGGLVDRNSVMNSILVGGGDVAIDIHTSERPGYL